MNKDELTNFIKKNGIEDFIENDNHLFHFVFEKCPMYIVKEAIGVCFYLQFDTKRDYSRIKEFVLEATPILSEMLENKRKKDLLP